MTVSISESVRPYSRASSRPYRAGWRWHFHAGLLVVPAADLPTQLAAAEAELPTGQIARYDSFDGTVMVDEDLI